MLDASMRVFHAAVFTHRQAFARGLQIFYADVFFLAGLQALGGSLVRGRHGPMALDVLFGFRVLVLRICY